MGAKTWMLVYASKDVPDVLKSQPAIDRDASTALAKKLFPNHELTPLADGTLTFACPPGMTRSWSPAFLVSRW
jgi:hypothetical protein